MKRCYALFKERLLARWFALRHGNVLENFAQGADGRQNAVDIFKGEWVTSFPPDVPVRAGEKPLYEDGRLLWLNEQVPLSGRTVLELGPMEGSHTYQLLKMGAASVTAIESNQRAFLKCLVAKELLGLDRARFQCADFTAYLEEEGAMYDVCVASGVLYHMREPLRLLERMCARARIVFLWTHYYDAAHVDAGQAHRFGRERELSWKGYRARAVRRDYGAQVWNPLHLGGDAAYSYWLSREDILGALAHYGFDDIVTGQEQTDAIAGPAFCVIAQKGAGSHDQPFPASVPA